MVGSRSTTGSFLERKDTAAFLVAGVLLTVYAALNGIDAFTAAAYPTIENVVGPAGFVVGFVGLLALYPSLADQRPAVARAGALFATLGAAGFSVVVVTSFGRLMGVLSAEPPGWYPLLLGLLLTGMLFGFSAFGVASLRTGTHPLAVGLLLLGPPVIFAVMLSGVVHMLAADAIANFLISSGQAAVYLSLGATLRFRDAMNDTGPLIGDVVTS